jgi:hypothetical protein
MLRQRVFPLDRTGETAVELSIAPEEYPAFLLPGAPQTRRSGRRVATTARRLRILRRHGSAAVWRTLPS